MKPLEVLNYLCQNNLIPSYPNTVVAQRILLPVSRCSKWGKEFLQININKIKEKHLRGAISKSYIILRRENLPHGLE
jgi:hypothetical protein